MTHASNDTAEEEAKEEELSKIGSGTLGAEGAQAKKQIWRAERPAPGLASGGTK